MNILRGKAEELLDERLDLVLTAAGESSVQGIRQDISTAYPPASSPGNPPHYREGKLFQGIHFTTFKVDETVTIAAERAGTPMVAYWLEFGTHRMAARPYMTPNMLNESNIRPALEKF
jgi:hypothetical protein